MDTVVIPERTLESGAPAVPEAGAAAAAGLSESGGGVPASAAPADANATAAAAAADAPGVDDKKWPPWFREACEFLRSQSSDDRWQAMLTRWVAFETNLGFADGKAKKYRLNATARPDQFHWWQSRARGYENLPPDFGKPSEYAAAVKTFYIRLQPDARGSTWPLAREACDSSDWSELNKGGKKGVLTILILLAWWQGLEQTKKERQGLDEVVDDVSWILDQLLAVERGGKRSREEDDSDPTPSKRARLR
ncbi:hypothetical protein BC834DRAFT_608805 [Gloeopeniophorella convolvens]|nr:hypothetical protein BC834DRAFT_608805 [Gloeopeniophorella convolvens]